MPDGPASSSGGSGRTATVIGVFLGAMLALGLAVVLYKIRGIFLPFLVGLFVAYVLDPVLDWLEGRGLTRAAAVWLVTVLFLGVLTVFFATVGPLIVSQLQGLAQDLPDYGRKIQAFYQSHEEQFELYLADIVEREPGRLRTLYLPLWADGGAGALRVLVTDRTGEAFAYEVGPVQWEGWRDTALALRPETAGLRWSGHKGGDANETVDQPITHVTLELQGDGAPGSGRIALGDPSTTEDSATEGAPVVSSEHVLPTGVQLTPTTEQGATADTLWQVVPGSGEGRSLVLEYALPKPSSVAAVSVPVRIPLGAVSLLDEAAARVQHTFSANLPAVVQNAVTIATGSLRAMLMMLLIMLISFHFMLVIDPFRRGLVDLVPERRRDYARVVLDEITRMLGAYLRGLTVVCVLVGLSSTAFLLVLSHVFHMKYALLVGLVAGLTYAVPYVGATVTALLAGLVGALTAEQNPLLCGLLAVGIQVAINQFYDNIVMPKIVGQRVGLHPLAVIFGLMAGYQLWGIVGMIVAVPVVASVKIIIMRAYPAFARADAEVAEARRDRLGPPLLPIIVRRLPGWLRIGPLAAEPAEPADASRADAPERPEAEATAEAKSED